MDVTKPHKFLFLCDVTNPIDLYYLVPWVALNPINLYAVVSWMPPVPINLYALVPWMSPDFINSYALLDVTKPYTFYILWCHFGAFYVTRLYKFIRFGGCHQTL
jgi:hypothetical protein